MKAKKVSVLMIDETTIDVEANELTVEQGVLYATVDDEVTGIFAEGRWAAATSDGGTR